MAFRSVVNHHLGQQEAHCRLTIQVTETLFYKCYSSNFLCERLAAVPAFLGGHFFSEDVTLPQEEEGSSCYWMCGLRAAGHFLHATESAGRTGKAALVSSQSTGKHCLSRQGQRVHVQYLRTQREIIPATSIPLAPRNVLMCQRNNIQTWINLKSIPETQLPGVRPYAK